MKDIVQRLLRWLETTLDSRPALRATRVEEPPEQIATGLIYLVGDGVPWSVMLVCPCGCNQTIALSLIPNDRPRWRAREHQDGSVSISPSIWRTKGCKSHFFVKKGRIVWATHRLRSGRQLRKLKH